MAMTCKQLGTEEGWKRQDLNLMSLCLLRKRKSTHTHSKVFIISEEQMNLGWEKMEGFLELYKNHSEGGHLSVYNSPNIVTLSL
jgi:hypothetical protein